MENDDPYADGAAAPQGEPPKDQKSQDEDPTELLSKSFFQGKDLEVGSRCEVEITQIMDDQVSVKYVPHEESKTEERSESMPPSAGMGASESDPYA